MSEDGEIGLRPSFIRKVTYLNEKEDYKGEALMWKALLKHSLEQYSQGDITAYVYNQLGAAYYRDEQFKEAEMHFRESLVLRKELFGANSKEVANCLSSLASAIRDQGKDQKMPEAEKHYKNAIGILEGLGDNAIADLPFVLECYAKLLKRLGRTAEANEVQRRSQAINGKHK